MSNTNCSWFKLSLFAAALLTASSFTRPVNGQSALSVRVGDVNITGIPEDWSSRHVVFSNPGTEQEAIQSGRHEQWQEIVDEPRYVIQQMKKGAPVQGPAAVDVGYTSRWISEAAGITTPSERLEEVAPTMGLRPRNSRPIYSELQPLTATVIKKDWAMSLEGPGLAAGQYPAKYSFSTTTASCSDYVVYPTGIAGSGSQATIVAFNKIYDTSGAGGCNSTSMTPAVYWAFNTPPGGVAADSATANLSPVLSLDGTQLAFVETYSSTGYLVILKMASEPTSSVTSPSSALTYAAPTSYHT